MRKLLLTAAISSILLGCGGGGGGSDSTPVNNANPATNQAVLGPLSGATIYAYRLEDIDTPIEGPITATSGTDVSTSGQFALALAGIADDEWVLVSASNGEDIDANDDGTSDSLATSNGGTIFGVAKASTWKAGEGKLTALSDIAWRYVQDQRADTVVLAARLESLADWLMANDITGDSNISYDDVIGFIPSQHQGQTGINYSALLPSGDSANPNYIDRLHLGHTAAELETSLQASFGASPWAADITPAMFSFNAANNVDFAQGIESEAITINSINRSVPISIRGGEYSLNGAAYTSEAGSVNRGDTVKVRLTSANNHGAPTTATLTVGGVAGAFVATTYSLDATPEAFSFTDRADVAPGSEVESNTITVSGINGPAAISVSAGEYSVNDGAFSNIAATVNNGDRVKVKITASSQNATAVNATLTIGGVSDSFDVTTVAYTAHTFLHANGPLGSLGMPMVFIDAAGKSFTQGCHDAVDGETGINNDPVCHSDEKPERSVTFANSFAISAHEVTFAAWDACVSDGGCNNYSPDDEGWGRGTRPVINVSYNDIQSFITWLNGKTGQSFRLPTESEWEYVARAGSSTVYPWGDAIGTNNGNCRSTECGDSFANTSPVGSFAANTFGLFDTQGNVWEWIEDIYHSDYNSAPIDGSARITGIGGAVRIVRGGSWDNSSFNFRSAIRDSFYPSDRLDNLGFRLVQDL